MSQRMNNKEINEAFNSLKEEFESYKKKYDNLKNSIQENINNYKSLGDDRLEALDKKINEIETKKKSLDNYYNKLFNKEDSINDQIIELKREIEDYYKRLTEGEDGSNSIEEDISNIYKEISNYQKELFGYKGKDKSGQLVDYPGIKDEIEQLKEKYQAKINSFEEKTGKIIEEKTDEMDSLLNKMDINYNAVEQEALSKKYFALARKKNTSITYITILITLYSLFLTGALTYLFTSKELQELFNNNNVIVGAIIRIAITVPIMYLIVITSRRLSRELTVRDHYNFKGSIMSSYRNISTHIKNEEIEISKDKQTELLENAYNIILENEADKIEMSNQSNLQQFNKLLNRVSKDFGLNKETLVGVLPEIIEKAKKKPEKQEKPQKTRTNQQQ